MRNELYDNYFASKTEVGNCGNIDYFDWDQNVVAISVLHSHVENKCGACVELTSVETGNKAIARVFDNAAAMLVDNIDVPSKLFTELTGYTKADVHESIGQKVDWKIITCPASKNKPSYRFNTVTKDSLQISGSPVPVKAVYLYADGQSDGVELVQQHYGASFNIPWHYANSDQLCFNVLLWNNDYNSFCTYKDEDTTSQYYSLGDDFFVNDDSDYIADPKPITNPWVDDRKGDNNDNNNNSDDGNNNNSENGSNDAISLSYSVYTVGAAAVIAALF